MTPTPTRAPARDVLIDEAQSLLGSTAPAAEASTADWIAALTSLLEAHGDTAAHDDQARHLEQLGAVEARGRRHRDARRSVRQATTRLGMGSSPGDLLPMAADALAQLAGVRRVVLGAVAHGELRVQSVAVRGDAAAAAALLRQLQDEPLRLGHPLLEADLLRRRRAIVVDAVQERARVHPRLAESLRWGELVAAPVAAGSAVIAILYADAGPATVLPEDTLELVEAFTAEIARTYETARLRQAVRRERHELERFSIGLGQRSRALLDTAHQLELVEPVDQAIDRRSAAAPAEHGRFAGVLTPRELEVLELLSTGCTNRAIAERLVLSPATVKSHVYRILAKLEVANRAQAVGLYLTPRPAGR